jgi:hypothetical protein
VVDVTATGVPRERTTTTVGGFSRRRLWLLMAIGVALILIATVATWFANYEPLIWEGGVYTVRPIHAITGDVDATSPDGLSFTQYTLAVPDDGSFRYLFTVTNTAAFPVTVRVDVPDEPGLGPRIIGWWIGEQNGGQFPTTSAPYRIAAHGTAAVLVESRMVGCIGDGTYGFGTVPLTFTTAGILERHEDFVMPMWIAVTSPDGTSCPNVAGG